MGHSLESQVCTNHLEKIHRFGFLNFEFPRTSRRSMAEKDFKKVFGGPSSGSVV